LFVSSKDTSISADFKIFFLDFNKREIRIFYDGGRLIRPLLIVTDNKLGLTEEVLEDIKSSDLTLPEAIIALEKENG